MDDTKTRPAAREPADDGPGERRSLREQAHAEIKRRIITYRYEPGRYLNELSVSRELGIGRTPVHQALNRLSLEGMVEVIPRKGVIVKPVSLHEVMQIVEARLGIEPHAVRLAAQRAKPGEIDRMERILDEALEAMGARDIERLMELDRDFHGTIAAASDNDVLAEMLRNLHDRALRLWFISLNDEKHLRGVQAEHAEILAALRNRDSEAAADRMAAHIRAFGDNIRQQI